MPAGKTWWVAHAESWLATLRDMKDSAECPEEELTTFERNLLETLELGLDDRPKRSSGQLGSED